MNDWLLIILILITGLVLGAFFFIGLWWTVQKGLASEHPAAWFLISIVIRTCIVVAGLYFVSDRQWQRLAIGLSGFILARLVLVRIIGKHTINRG